MAEHLQLSELTHVLEQGIKQTFPKEYWVVAEISECSINSKGHCYLELIEKPEQSDSIVAKIRATIWAYNYRLISAYFKSSTGIDIQGGLKILVKASVEFHAVFGLSLNITDIDPIYTLGEDEKQRRDIILRLQNEGIADMNKEVQLPLVPQRIAIISSAQAAGYQDFIQQLQKNQYTLKFHTTLFPAAMQGQEVEQSIIQAFDAIFEQEENFDIVVIIRGGGSKSDLRWFDNYTIAANIAQFPLPIITGIGHDKDESIADIVAHTALKTPTAVAEFLLSKATNVLFTLEDFEQTITDLTNELLEEQHETISDATQRIHTLFQTIVIQSDALLQKHISRLHSNVSLQIEKEKSRLASSKQHFTRASQIMIHKKQNSFDMLQQRLQNSMQQLIQKQNQSMQLFETKIMLHNPEHILAQGYSITTNAKGEIIKSAQQTSTGEVITTKLHTGSLRSKVE